MAGMAGSAPKLEVKRLFATKNPAMRQALDDLKRAAEMDVITLLLGETGTGKDLLASQAHVWSSRAKGPFAMVNCATIPADLEESELFGHVKGAFTGADADKIGLVESAQHGMLSLNEIGDATLSMQKLLLDLVQDRTFRRVGALGIIKLDIGIIAATHRNLRNMISLGLFREDLFYRISVMEISLPPLRERREDLPELARGFLEEFSDRYGRQMRPLEPGTLRLLLGHRWPGNIRELRHFIQQLVVRSRDDRITETLVEECLKNSRDSRQDALLSPSHEEEKRTIKEALDRHGGIKVRAARELGMDRGTLAQKMRRYGII